MCSPIASITDALLQYERAFNPSDKKNVYAKSPEPPYVEVGVDLETNSQQPVWDMCFHLLKLYSSRSHPLERLLNPATYTPDPLDYRLRYCCSYISHITWERKV